MHQSYQWTDFTKYNTLTRLTVVRSIVVRICTHAVVQNC